MTMYLEHFGLREAPFKITPHTEFFFAGANRGETLEALIYAIMSGEGIVKVTGEVGAGKTMLCRVLMERLPKSVETIYFAVPSLSPDELLATVASDLGLATDGRNITKLIRALQGRLIEIYGSGKRVVALIDEAHAMPVETLDQIRLLSNLETSHEKLIQIVLFGQPELDQHLSMPNIRQLKERITHSFNLLPLPPQDIKDYLNFRLRAAGYHGPDLFGKDALKLIAEASEGLTRRINIYADKTLLAAYAASTHTITADHVRAAISDTQIVLPGAKSDRRKRWLAMAGALLVGAALGFVVGRYSISAAPASAPLSANASTGVVKELKESPAKSPVIAVIADATAIADASATKLPATSAPMPSASNASIAEKPGASTPESATAPTPKGLPSAGPSGPAPKTAVVAELASGVTENPKREPINDWLGQRLTTDSARITALPKDRFTIQLMSAEERGRSAIETYVTIASRELNAELIMLYPTGSAENPRVSVLYGNFDGATAAGAALGRVPTRISKFRPYVRSFDAVRNDVRQVAP